MKKLFFFISVVCLMACQTKEEALDADKELGYCIDKVSQALNELRQADNSYDYSMEPRNILKEDTQKGWNCRKASPQDWSSGFWPGILWMDYGITKDETVRQQAEGYTEVLAMLTQEPVYDHDIGFLTLCSYGKGYDQTHRDDYKKMMLDAADSLALLYNPKAGTILSWPRHVKDYGGHNTIMDNMINLELLFWAAQEQNNNDKEKHEKLYDIAVRHAETTMQHQFRDDGSCYHVAVYDTLSGEFIKGVTHQGYADSSMWARGQAWAIYGYTMVYRFTKEQRFLEFAQKVTDIYLRRLEETSNDWVPLWDMDDPMGMEAPKDASAACIVASGLLELCQYVTPDKGKQYYDAAVNMLTDLSKDYQSGNQNVAFLMHSTGHKPAGSEIDASIIYADYYYMEALLRLKTAAQPQE
ncbi:MAG: glycoside hydrolase family 88 protein [Prevotella sp.]|nr:glycoside hydrolase family 88 protein [Prevotella sp.]